MLGIKGIKFIMREEIRTRTGAANITKTLLETGD